MKLMRLKVMIDAMTMMNVGNKINDDYWGL